MKILILALIFVVLALLSLLLMMSFDEHRILFLTIGFLFVGLAIIFMKIENTHDQKKRERLLGLVILFGNVAIIAATI
jgi:drug/metabolite transporter (DMT)-like permease